MPRTADSLQVIWQKQFQEITSDQQFPVIAGSVVYERRMDHPASWWHNPMNPDSLRLSKPAFNLLKKYKVQNWRFELPTEILPRTLLQLEKFFTAPYHIQTLKLIWVYGETEAIMLALHTNNLQQYLDNQNF